MPRWALGADGASTFGFSTAMAVLWWVAPWALGAEEPKAEHPPGAVTIHTDFPGGNAAVEKIDGPHVHVAPDLRGDRPWFYWCFEARTVTPGQITFVFPEKVGNIKNGGVGNQGPAISRDQGKTWDWMGRETVRENTFSHRFREPGEAVRFAVALPYVQSDLDAFLKSHADNPRLKRSVLTKSRQGREVDLLQVGEAGADRTPVLITGRHHAAETVASYVLEGFVHEALSDSAAGVAFREKYVLFAVPFVDADGVHAGDQGKNRKPHDHNRDYGEPSIYPEVQAIKDLDKTQNFRIALDFHCPTLMMPDHQVIYFVGAKQHPPLNMAHVTEFSRGIKASLPAGAPAGPLVWLRDEDEPSPKNSRYFAFRPNVLMSATLEFPFCPPGKSMSPSSCRAYGACILRAFTETHFQAPAEK